MDSYALKGFLSRCKEDGKLIRTTGTPLGHSIINLSTIKSSKVSLEKSSASDDNELFEKRFPVIKELIKAVFLGDLSDSSTSYGHRAFDEQNSIVSQVYQKFMDSGSSDIKIVWVKNHSTLVELMKENLPASISLLIGRENENLTTFFVDVSFFLNSNSSFDLITNNQRFLTVLFYRLAFVRGMSRFLNFSDKESYHITLSLLDGEENIYYRSPLKLTDRQSLTLASEKSLRSMVANFLETNVSILHLDHDQSLSHCLKELEKSCQDLPRHVAFKNVFELEKLLTLTKDKNLRSLIKASLMKRDRQIILLIKQMDISLPYPRHQFQTSYKHNDIKVRRELCFQLIKNFDRSTESLNIASVVSRLRNSSKYSINQPKLVCGRESRAFGNQAYLFANSKLIEINADMINVTNELKSLCSIERLKQIIQDSFSNQNENLLLNHEYAEILTQILSKFKTLLYELVPSIGRLISLVFNQSKSSSFTQYNGVFQNLREALEIFLRKSSADVEKLRKKFIEEFFESSTRSNGITSSLTGLNHQSHALFFNKILNALQILSGKSGQVERLIQEVEQKVYALYSSSTGSIRGAFSVLLQRPSFAGSERFKLNELEIKPEQEESLQKLVLNGGDHLYMSPSYEWIAEATDLIEAVPLFIYERTVITNEKPMTVFEVDQEGLEQTIRQIAEFWAQNIDLTIESEHLTLARSIIVRLNPKLNELAKKIELYEDTVADKVKYDSNLCLSNKEVCNLIAIESLVSNESRQELAVRIAKLAELLGLIYNEVCVEVEAEVERSWSFKDFVTRIEAFERILIQKNLIDTNMLAKANQVSESNETKRLASRAFDRQRPLPAFHLLTTEAPGLVEGFITVVLEEEMAMRNVIKSYGLEDEVKKLSTGVQKKLAVIADQVITEFGYDPIVSQNIANGMSREQSVLRVMAENIPIEEQVSKLSILLQMYYYENSIETSCSNISLPYSQVDRQTLENAEIYWINQIQIDLELIKQDAYKQVWETNKNDYDFNEALHKFSLTNNSTVSLVDSSIEEKFLIEFLTNDPIYSEEAKASIKWITRAKSFEHICSKYPDLYLNQRAKSFIREHTSLIQTTCRRHVISSNGLHAQLCHPRFAYSSGVTFDDNNNYTASGLRKRYHLIYAPSRVNLGKDERKSVENWSQFLGVSDSLAARHAQEVYEMINYSPVIRNIREAENLKVSENQWTALIRSVRNVHAFFVERLGVGDIEDLSYQFNQRGGMNFGSQKEGEGYNSGPTAGYCIPKDLLFKLFVGTHQDSRKLIQIGVPKFLHQNLISLMAEVYSYKNKFATIGEWELWAANEFLNKEALSKRFESADSDNDQTIMNHISSYLQNYIKLSGSRVVFHLTKLINILGNTGVPSPFLSEGRDLHSVLWSNWSDHKITLGGEQVNRATVFTLTREIPESAKRSRLLNPKAGIVQEDALRVVMNGVYKGDDDEPPPPDVRYSWTMRAFQIMSGHYQAVADSLDLEGQVIARLSWIGFKPDSEDPKDIETTEYLLKKFDEDCKEMDYSTFRKILNPSQESNQEQLAAYNKMRKLVKRLKKAFPCHSTVGDVTMTAVHGVDSEDLLGFSAETLTLLGDEADRAKRLLETHGHMSYDQMRANAVLRRKFPEEWTPLNQLSAKKQQNIKELVGGSIHPLVLRLRGPGTNFISDLQGQDVVVFSITHPEILKLDPAHLRDLMIVGRPNSALCVLDYVAQGRHRCWFERDVMLWYAASRGLTTKGQLSLDWTKRNEIGRQSVYKAFGTGIEKYSPSLGTDLRSEVVRQERRSIEIWNCAKNVLDLFLSKNDEKAKLIDSILNYQKVLSRHLSSDTLLTEALFYQQYSQKLLMSKRFKCRDKIIQESTQKLSTTAKHQLPREFTAVDWLSIGGMFLINGTPKTFQNEILDVIRKVNHILKSENNNPESLELSEIDLAESDLISKLIVAQLQPSRITLGEKKGEMFSVKASEDSQSRAVTRRAQLSMQSELQLSLKHRSKGFEMLKINESELTLETVFANVRKLMLELSKTPSQGYSIEFINEKFGLITKYTITAVEIIIKKIISASTKRDLSKEDFDLRDSMISSINTLYNNGSIDLKVIDAFCGTYEDHGFISRLLEHSNQNEDDKFAYSQSVQEILSVCELLYYILALEKTSQFLSTNYADSSLWRKLSEFFAKTIDDHFYEYNPWILDCKRGSSWVHIYDELGTIKPEYNQFLYSTSWIHHRVLYKYFNNLIHHHSDIVIKVPNENDRNLLIGLVNFGEKTDGSEDTVQVTSIGNSGVGEEFQASSTANFEALWRSYNQLREISFMRNDGFEFPVVFSSFDPNLAEGLNASKKINLAILSPIGRTHYSRAIMESSYLNDNVFITRTGFFSDDGKNKLTLSTSNAITKEKTYLFIQDAHLFLNEQQYHASLKHHFGMNDSDAANQIALDKKLERFTEKGIRIAAKFKAPVLIGCCIAHHHHPLEIALTEAGYPATDKSPFLFDLTYNKSLYPLIYSSTNSSSNEQVLLPPQIDWLKDETFNILDEQVNKHAKSYQQAEEILLQTIKQRLRPFAFEHGIIIAKGSAESGSRNLSRFDIRNLGFESSDGNSSSPNDLIDENILHEAAKFIYQVSKGQNVTIQRAIVSTPLSWMSEYAVKKFLERQIIEHSVSVNIEKYPKDFIYGTLRVIFSSSVPADLNDISNPNNWEASHLISLSSLQMATNVGRQGTLEILSEEMINSKFRDKFIEKLSEAGKKAMSLTSMFGPKYWNEEINLDGSGMSYKSNNDSKLDGSNHQKILPYKLRKPNLPEKDACGIPYWWPRYLMLDIIAEALFVDNEGKEIVGAHILDIKNDFDNQSIYLIRDRNGRVCEGRIYDFLFWLLEPNVGIGLWPNYWKRELVRCQERNPNDVHYEQVGVSDRIVLNNFLKAGQEFLKVKSKTNALSNSISSTRLNETANSSNTVSSCSLSEPSAISSCLYDALSTISLKHGIISVRQKQVSLWISEALKLAVSQKYSNLAECTCEQNLEIFEYSLELIKSIKEQDIMHCIEKSKNLSNLASLIPSINVESIELINWLAEERYSRRICEIMMDSLLSQPLTPFLEISPVSLSFNGTKSVNDVSRLVQNQKTFCVISDKTSLLTHQLYPFITGRQDYPINVVGVHTSWIISQSNLTTRAIFYDHHSHSFVEGDLDTPLILDYGFILELYLDNEVSRHAQLTNEYESAGLKIINNASLSRQRADDKLWIRENKPNGVITPKHIVFTQSDLESETNESELVDRIKSLLKSSEKGLVIQPSANTTESSLVQSFPSSSEPLEILNAVRKVHLDLSNHDKSSSVLVSEFRGNVRYKESPIVFRFNVSQSQISCAAYVDNSPQSKIVGLKGSQKDSNLGGYCERLDIVLRNMYEESTKKKVSALTSKTWNSILNTARLVAKSVGLPLVGIDMLIESFEDSISVVVLEVNARPGTLIFGEELIFDETGSFFTHSLMAAPVNEDFWNLITQMPNDLFLNETKSSFPETLIQWKSYLSSRSLLNSVHSKIISDEIPLLNWFTRRYGSGDPSLIIDRINCLIKTIDDCIMNEDKFDLNKNIAIVFSNGRDRYFGGHTDLLGLGGPTINATTENEIIAVIQQTNDSLIHVSNSNREYNPSSFGITEILDSLEKNPSFTKQLGKVLWNPNEWTSYLKGSIAYMLSPEFSRHEKVKDALLRNNTWTGCRIHFSSFGRLELLSKVGSSSSSALTSAFVLGLNKIFSIGLDKNELSETDYGEFYLGKSAGCADKTAILNAKKGHLVAITSIPDRYFQSLLLPNQIIVIMANSNIPRLNSLKGKSFLSDLKNSSGNVYSAKQVDSIVEWANGIMRRFGSYVFVRSVEIIIESLTDELKYSKVGITKEEAETVLNALSNEIANTSSKPLLRELCVGGKLEKNFSNYSGWKNRHRRYNLIFKILKLLPESIEVSIGDHTDTIYPRKSTLYGISEIERCHGYLAMMNRLNKQNAEKKHVMKLLNFVRWAHDGDRAVEDYRNDFKPTAWASDSRNLLSDQILDKWIMNEHEEISNKPGGFERSLPEFDEWAISLDEKFQNQAALRVAAAGLGGSICIHSLNSIANEVISWLKNKGCSVRTVHPGPSFDIL